MLPPVWLGWWMPLWHLGLPGSWALLLWWRVVEDSVGNQCCGHLCCVWSCHLHGLQVRGRGWSVGAAVTGGMNPASTAAWFPVATGDAETGDWSHMCPFLLSLGSLGLQAHPSQKGDGITGTTYLVPPFPLILCVPAPPPPHFWCTGVWISLVSWCVGQRNLCWVLDVLLVVDWMGETEDRLSPLWCWNHSLKCHFQNF